MALLHGAADPFARALPAHVTASALVLDPARRQVLLVHHAKLGRWVQPGGHVDATDAGLAAAALREAREETGVQQLVLLADGPVDLDRHPAPCLPPGASEHLDLLYLCQAPGDAVPVVSAESTDVRWFDVDALPADAVPSLAGRVAAALGQRVSSTR